MYETEYEVGIQPEFEAELEEELEDELEGELEDEGEFEDEREYEFEDEFEDEDEGEFEDEGEYEDELSPVRKVYPDAVMEHLGALAAEAESEEEAVEHFLPLIGMAASKLLPLAAKAIAPMAKRALPRIVKAVTRVTPQLTRGVGRIARTLHRKPAGRRLLRAVPTIARRTVHSIARQAAHKRAVTPRMAVRTLARQARRVLRSPGTRTKALRRHYRMDRRFHRRIGRGVVGPHAGRRYGRLPGVGGQRHLRAGSRVAPRSGVRYGRTSGGRCVCGASAAPNYCGCCGQITR
jgi:hypothetical protein